MPTKPIGEVNSVPKEECDGEEMKKVKKCPLDSVKETSGLKRPRESETDVSGLMIQS